MSLSSAMALAASRSQTASANAQGLTSAVWATLASTSARVIWPVCPTSSARVAIWLSSITVDSPQRFTSSSAASVPMARPRRDASLTT